tara:strand:+ start:1019 stop:1231 length:213 start_codon:yes stop_codon:yes gene_type:complete
LTHGRIWDKSLREALGIIGNPTFKIVYHDLQRDGTINYYNMQIGKETFFDVPASLVESINEQDHEHEERD